MKFLIVSDNGEMRDALLQHVELLEQRTNGTALIFLAESPCPNISLLAVDELPELIERLPGFFAMDLVAPEVIRPLSLPWWHLHDVPELLDPPAQIEVPHRAFRPVHQPGLSGKRTRQSQKLHNRRAA